MTTPPTPPPPPSPTSASAPTVRDQGEAPAVHRAMHPLTARGLISDEHGRWLIVRAPGQERWHLPGGLVEQNEPVRDACAREIREELGLEMVPGALIAVGWTAPRRPGRHARVTFIFAMGTHPAADLERVVVLQRSELADWRLASPREALNLLHPDVALRLAAHRGMQPTAVYVEHHPARGPVLDHRPR